MNIGEGRSIVAIDPTTRGIAFVFFENGNVMDWGERLRRREGTNELGIVDALVEGCAADVLVLENPDAPAVRRKPRIKELLRAIAKHARRRGTSVIAVARDDVCARSGGQAIVPVRRRRRPGTGQAGSPVLH